MVRIIISRLLDTILTDSQKDQMKPVERKKGIRILCLDGGGMKGLVEIELLRQLSILIFDDPSGKKLIECFDLIAGTSTGAILTVALSMGKSLEECEKLYLNLGQNIFGSKSTYWAGRWLRYLWSGDFYSSFYMEQFFEAELGGDKTKTLSDVASQKKVFLVATDASNELWFPYLFTSYQNPNTKYQSNSGATLVEALRATSAAPGYFKPEHFGKFRLLDGGLIANNPTEVAFIEARTLWPDREVELVVSMGTGNPENPDIPKETMKNLIMSIIDMETSSLATHFKMKNWLSVDHPSTHYFRFSPPHLGSFQLDESSPAHLQEMVKFATQYMQADKHAAELKSLLLSESSPPSSTSTS
eukprot:TRINITY_DN8887_c0_g1_i1.p1 TRINITY_DN8887_c0_g1~~TRINITY_DN8887_c0_g1_i1.p1  ORF type:complete len:358 (+),score=93.35 TRINITY_DN8887_c0_g1_i1:56-1129(+)